MKRIRKLFLTALVCLVAIFGALGFSSCSLIKENLTWENDGVLYYQLSLDKKSYSVIGLYDDSVSEVVIPATFHDKPVVSVDGLYEKEIDFLGMRIREEASSWDNLSLQQITISDGVTSIGSSVFRRCYALKYVEIPASVTSIGDYAFYNCSKLTNVENGNGVQSVGNSAFAYCTDLVSIGLGNSVQSLGDFAFAHCSSLTSMTMGDNVQSIGNSAFYKCSALSNVQLGDSIQSIGDFAFAYCSSFTSVDIGDNVKILGNAAFSYCSDLTDVVFGKNLNAIGEGVFAFCPNLKSIVFEDTDTWYRANNSKDWENRSGGIKTDVADADVNVINFGSTYRWAYWYKL